MKRFAFYSLEGLIRQRGGEVWISIGTFASRSAAKVAAVTPHHRPFAETRIIAHFRDSTGGVPQRPHVRPARMFDRTTKPVAATVA